MPHANGRDLTDAVVQVGRAASSSAAQLLSVARRARGSSERDLPEPAAEIAPEPAPPPPTVVSANAVLTGGIATPDGLEVHGRVEGDVRARKVAVCAGGAIVGDVFAETADIHGAVEGRIEATHVRLCAGAQVKGEIAHATLGIDTAAAFEGAIVRMNGEDKPAPAKRARRDEA